MKKDKFINNITDFILPSHCFSCNCAVEKGAVICNDCFSQLEYTSLKTCNKCGLNKSNCDCKRFVYHFESVYAPFYNKDIAQRGIYGIKFNDDIVCVKFFAQNMVKTLQERAKDVNIDFVTYVPMNPLKMAKRGYNQSHLLAKEVALIINSPLKSTLKRNFSSRTQHRAYNTADRFNNAYNGYNKKKTSISGNVLLIDDIKTTGASLDACAKELLYMGADKVFCLVALITDKNS